MSSQTSRAINYTSEQGGLSCVIFISHHKFLYFLTFSLVNYNYIKRGSQIPRDIKLYTRISNFSKGFFLSYYKLVLLLTSSVVNFINKNSSQTPKDKKLSYGTLMISQLSAPLRVSGYLYSLKWKYKKKSHGQPTKAINFFTTSKSGAGILMTSS